MRLIPTIPDEAFVFLGRAEPALRRPRGTRGSPNGAQRSQAGVGTSSRIYFDHSATTPLDPRVLEAMGPFLGGAFGNPSSRHEEGRLAHAAVDKAREQVAALIGATPDEIIFTASGTEADNLALIGTVRAIGKPWTRHYKRDRARRDPRDL